MSDQSTSLEELIGTLKKERDELKLKMHLASMDAKDEYKRLSGVCDKLTKQVEPLRDAVGDTAENVLAALALVADELKIGFQRVRRAITEDQ